MVEFATAPSPGVDKNAPRDDAARANAVEQPAAEKPANVANSMALGPTMPEAQGDRARASFSLGSRETLPDGPVIDAGTVIKHYEIIRKLGAGGMGVVFLARDTRLGRLVAIKFLLTHSDQEGRGFLVEARMTARCRHENIVVIYDVDELDGYPYMVLEYVEGRTLRDLLNQRDRDTASRAVEIMLPVVRALGCAHEMGIIHRDLKPENIYLSSAGQVKVLDFGIAKQVTHGLAGATRETLAPVSLRTGMTQDSAVSGTMPYMSPEQWLAEPLDGRTDMWAVGIMLFELVTGEHPLKPATPQQLLTVVNESIPMPSLREVLPELSALADIVDRCLKKPRAERYESIAQLQEALEGLLRSESKSAASVDDNASPFAGLSAFQEADARRFFGRERDIAVVMGKLRHQQLVAIAGPSGAGKSSFVRAGVIPALKQSGSIVESFVVRPGRRPLAALADVLAFIADSSAEAGADTDAIVETLKTQPGYLGARLRGRCRKRGQDHRIVLFIDQLEELHTLGIDAAERAAFCACVEGVADDASSPLRVIATIRADFLDRLSDDRRFMEEVTRGLLFLPPLGREGLVDALKKPLEGVRYRFEDEGLCEEMLADLQGTKSPLPLLQFTASKLWELRDTEARILTRQSYRALGGVAGALSTHADAVIEGFAGAEQRVVRSILMRLVTPERTRAIVRMGELHALEQDTGVVDSVVDRLAAARLVSIESGDDQEGKSVELTHESLIDRWAKLRQWLDENEQDAQFLVQLRNAATQWEKNGETEGLLWRDRAAIEAGQWLDRRRIAGNDASSVGLGPREERFLQAVVKYSERTRRWRQRIAIGVFAALIGVAVVVSTLALRAQEQAKAAERARARAESAMSEAKLRATEASDARLLAGYRELSLTGQRRWAAKLLLAVQKPDEARGWLEMANDAATGYETTLEGDGSPWLRNGAGGHRVTLRGAKKPIDCLAWSHDGKRIVAGSVDGTVRIWNASGEGDPIAFEGHRGAIHAAVFSPDDTRLLTASEDGTARIWNVSGNGEPVVLDAHAGALRFAAWNPQGSKLVTVSTGNEARVCSADGRGMVVLQGHKGAITSATFFPNGEQIVTASKDKTARVWNADGTNGFVFEDHKAEVLHAVPSPDGKLVLTTSADTTARIWSLAKGDKPIVLEGHRGEVLHGAWSPDGKRVATASSDMTARVWPMDRRDKPAILAAHRGPVTNVSFRSDGKYVLTASRDETTMVWPVDGGEALVLPGDRTLVVGAAFGPDGTHVLTAGASEEGPQRTVTATVWRPSRLESLWREGSRVSHSARLDARADGVFAAYDDFSVRKWRTDGTGERLIFESPGVWITNAAPNPDGTRVAIALFDKTAKVISSEGNAEPVVLSGHTGVVRAAVWSPDGMRIVTVSDDGAALVHSIDAAKRPAVRLVGHTDALTGAAWSPDGQRIVTTSMDHTARVWNADASGAPLVLGGHAASVNGAAWSADGRMLATASDDGTVQIRDSVTAEMVSILDIGRPIAQAVWSPDGKWLAIALRESGFEIFRAGGSGDAVLKSSRERILAMAFDERSKQLVTVGANHAVRVFMMDPATLARELDAANTDCLPENMRITYLGETADVAREQYAACERKHGRTPATMERDQP